MSRLNKVNPDHYTMAGRLSADDLARERMRQGAKNLEDGRRVRKVKPPWESSVSGATGPPSRRVSPGRSGEVSPKLAGDAVRAEADAKRATKRTRSNRGHVTVAKAKRPAVRRKATGAAVVTPRRKATTASGATRMRKGSTKSTGVTRGKQKKNRS